MENTELRNLFNKTLNSHGYPFQYSVIEAAKNVCESTLSSWIFEASEFPVEVNGRSTKIDFILQSKDKEHTYCLVAECKRVNPAFQDWCFVKAPIVCRNRSFARFNIESLRRYKHEDPLKVMTESKEILPASSYHIGMAVKSNKAKGDSFGNSDHDAIEKAASQVCLGLNGLVELGEKMKDMNLFRKTFIPVIFTTASLWASDCDLSKTNLADGNIDISKDTFEEKPWILYHYHLTLGIKHSVESHQSSKEIASILDFDYIRTIPIVNANYVCEFLSWFNPYSLFE